MSDKPKLSRHAAREIVFQLLFAREFDREADALEFYDNHADNSEIEYNDYIRETFLGVCGKQPELDPVIEGASIKWKMSRMSTATRSVLRLAVYEMTYTEVPAKVVLNEAVEIIKTFDDENAPAFVNGILNKIARDISKIGTENA
ncbi:MAG: transcription antitermination factor NusB [Clostridia bacterium]|nr:transcription antitermination factor NusB [Clostridia bacterium]